MTDIIYDQYFIPINYIINKNPSHDVVYNKKAQREVYLYASKIMKKYKLNDVVDIGCGIGWKLINYLGKFNTVGIECEPAFSKLKKKYPNNKWLESGKSEHFFNYENTFKTDLIICVDVIEHILDPNKLLNYINKFDFKYLIISTPCRDIMTNHDRFVNGRSKKYRRNNIGPSPNECHVREWTFVEFKKYLSKYFEIKESFLGKKQIECQWHLCVRK